MSDIPGLFDNFAGGTVVARDNEGARFLWSASKSRKLYTFQMEINSHRVISKDGQYVADLCPNRTLIISKKTDGGNFKVYVQFANVTSFCIENRQHLVSYQDAREFVVYDLLKKEPIYRGRLDYSCYSIVSEPRKFLLRHVWAESDLSICQIDNLGTTVDRISCDQVEFARGTSIAYIATRYGELLKYDCETNRQTRLTSKKNITATSLRNVMSFWPPKLDITQTATRSNLCSFTRMASHGLGLTILMRPITF